MVCLKRNWLKKSAYPEAPSVCTKQVAANQILKPWKQSLIFSTSIWIPCLGRLIVTLTRGLTLYHSLNPYPLPKLNFSRSTVNLMTKDRASYSHMPTT